MKKYTFKDVKLNHYWDSDLEEWAFDNSSLAPVVTTIAHKGKWTVDSLEQLFTAVGNSVSDIYQEWEDKLLERNMSLYERDIYDFQFSSVREILEKMDSLDELHLLASEIEACLWRFASHIWDMPDLLRKAGIIDIIFA